MTDVTVHTQTELDTALADPAVGWIGIHSDDGVWLEVDSSDSDVVAAANESVTVVAFGSSMVRAYGSSMVEACDSSVVRATDSATVKAYDSATVMVCDLATVSAHNSSKVTACDSTTVTANDSAVVTAYDSATVRAYDSSTVMAGASVAVHLHHSSVNHSGGVVIDHTQEAKMTPAEWCDHHGVQVIDGIAYVYKAVDDEWTTDRGFDYSPGSCPEASDWRDSQECGGGLHFSPTPGQALAYHLSATRFVRCGVSLTDLRPIPGRAAKCKVPRVIEPCIEVDIDGAEVVKAEVKLPSREELLAAGEAFLGKVGQETMNISGSLFTAAMYAALDAARLVRMGEEQ